MGALTTLIWHTHVDRQTDRQHILPAAASWTVRLRAMERQNPVAEGDGQRKNAISKVWKRYKLPSAYLYKISKIRTDCI